MDTTLHRIGAIVYDMSEYVPYNLGERIAHFRKLLKLSAEDLAERAGFGLTRSIVANLENGRKDDLSVRQLMAVAFVLEVSPADLIFDMKHPYRAVTLTGGESFHAVAAAWLARAWFGGAINRMQLNALLEGEVAPGIAHHGMEDEMTMISLRMRSQLLIGLDRAKRDEAKAIERANTLRAKLVGIEPRVELSADSVSTQDLLDQTSRELRSLRAELYTMDSQLRARRVDLEDPVHPGLPS